MVSETIIHPYAYVGIRGDMQVPASVMSEQLNHKKAHNIIEASRKYYEIESLEKMMARSRKTHVLMARHIAIFLIRRLTGLRDSDIAVYFKRDRTTILNSIQVVQDFIYTKDEDVITDVENIKAML